MTSPDPMTVIAEQVATRLAEEGIAFVEDDRVPALAETLTAFLHTAGIPLQAPQTPASGTPGPR